MLMNILGCVLASYYTEQIQKPNDIGICVSIGDVLLLITGVFEDFNV